MSIYETSITNPKKQLEFYKQLSEQLQQENKQLKENYERIYNENCKLKKEHNITDISLLDKNYKLKDNWNKLKQKMIEKITVREKTLGFPNGEWTARNMDKAFAIKINELIDEINNLNEGK